MIAVRSDLLALQIREFVDFAIVADGELVVDLIDGLAEIDPVVAAGASAVSGDMIATNEFDLAQRYRAMRLGRGDRPIVIDFQAMLLPGARIRR